MIQHLMKDTEYIFFCAALLAELVQDLLYIVY